MHGWQEALAAQSLQLSLEVVQQLVIDISVRCLVKPRLKKYILSQVSGWTDVGLLSFINLDRILMNDHVGEYISAMDRCMHRILFLHWDGRFRCNKDQGWNWKL